MNAVQYLFENSFNLEKDFVLGNKEKISFNELYLQVLQMASYINSTYGYQKNIILISSNSCFFIISYLGIMLSGNICVPLDPSIEIKNFEFILNETKSNVCFGEKKILDKLQPSETVLITDQNFQEIIHKYPDFKTDSKFYNELPAQIIFTSGSTGLPKGVVLSHKNLIANTSSILDYLQLTGRDIMEVVLPFYYCYGLSLLHTHLRVGGSIVLNNNFVFLATVLNDINKYGCTGFAGVPSHFQVMLRKTDSFKNNSFPTLRYVTQAGGKLHNSLIEEFCIAFPGVNFYVMYGQTEATARLSYLEPSKLTEKLGSIGKGIPNVVLKVADGCGNLVKPGETGEIIAKGDNIMIGYFNDLEGTAEVLKNGWLYTGDIGTVDEEGYIFLTARKKEIIKIAGKRVSPKEIEAVILTAPYVVDCSIESFDDDITGEGIKAVIVLKEGMQGLVNEEMIKIYCSDKLALYKIPKYVEFRKELSVAATGKKVIIR